MAERDGREGKLLAIQAPTELFDANGLFVSFI